MNPRFRLLLAKLLLVLVSAATALLLLTLFDRQLDQSVVHHFDLALQMRIHAWSSPWLTSVMLALTWIGSIRIFGSALALVLAAFLLVRRFHAAAVLGFAILGAFILNETLKLHFHRVRPHVAWSIGDEHTFSFPSGHALFSFSLYGTLAYLALTHPALAHPATPARRVTVLLTATLLPSTIGLSRIYLGMHYPTDVAAGFLVGGLWLAAVVAIDRQWHRYSASAQDSAPTRR